MTAVINVIIVRILLTNVLKGAQEYYYQEIIAFNVYYNF
jgi:hypothetical protein